jgi:pimeloyl-ACP methyl ester carboxylesterase
MDLLGPAMVRDLVSLIQQAETDAAVKVLLPAAALGEWTAAATPVPRTCRRTPRNWRLRRRGPSPTSRFGEPATEPAWKTMPSWFVYGDHDTAIVPKLHAFMAERAHPRATTVVPGASHVVMISHADAVAKVIEDAANAR